MNITIPDVCLVVLIGPSGSGKSSFARRFFDPTEILSSDACRALVADDENDQTATSDAFEILHFIAGKRLARQRLVVVDATNVQPEARKPLVALARKHDCLPVAIVLDIPARVCQERNRARKDRILAPHVVRQQAQQLRRSIRNLKREGFRHVTVLKSSMQVDVASVERVPLWTDRRHDEGPFDIIGDVHGCYDELVALLAKLGYEVDRAALEGRPGDMPDAPAVRAPAGRKVVFVGDLVDRGPNAPGVLRLAMHMVASGQALCVPGNHEVKLLKKLRGKDVRLTHGLAETMAQLAREPEGFGARVAEFLDSLVSHYVLDRGRLVVAHAGMKEELQGRASARVRDFALFGETTGETDEFGLPVRYHWAADYRGSAYVVYGHTPVPEAEWLNRTICIDTGCVFGGRLTALRYPERELVEVEARQVYYEPAKPLQAPAPEQARPAPRPYRDLLDIGDVQGKRIVSTRLHRTVTIREDNAAAALEIMSRFAVDPRWLIHLPPTMSPAETCADGDLLEHPREAFAYYRGQGVSQVVCEEKHMGSRAVVVVCRDADTAVERFGMSGGDMGAVYTRTGRPFFADARLAAAFLDRVRAALARAGFWQRHDTGWVCLDAEIMPWSSKAQELLRSQYAAVGAASRHALAHAIAALEQASTRTLDMAERPDMAALLTRYRARQQSADAFVRAYRQYCWPVHQLDDFKLAPFHILATEGRVHTDRDHVWHMEQIARVCEHDPALLRATAYRLVDVTDPADEAAGIAWWHALTDAGGEGMVVKPLSWLVKGKRGLVQPAIKCRGREYLRIIYGPEYTAPEHLVRLRARGLSIKRSLALRELALGLEALHRFVDREPLYRVHECVFGVLALESEPVDPRL